MDSEKKIIGRCPFCGGNVVKTCKGYRCENNTGEHPSCVLNINAIIGNRKMNDGEIAEFLEKRRILLDGFSTKEGKTFPTVLELADDGAVNMQSVIGRCPHCGGEVRVGTRAFNCSNYSNQEAPCSFAIWRNIGGHQLTLEEAKELCEKNITSSELEMYREDGSIYRKRLGLLLGMETGCSGNSENKVQDMAKKALMASVDNPESVKIVGISKPDSVFGREYVTMKEKMALSVAMMKISRRFMEDTDFDNPDSECHGMSGQMKRQMDAMTALRSLMVTGELKPTGDEASQERKPFSGWKVKIEYEATDSDGQPYRSEYWFIMDKEAQCVIRSFEIPLL